MSVVPYRYALIVLCAIIFFLLYWKVFQNEIMIEISRELVIALVAAIVISFLLETASRQELKSAVQEEIKNQLVPVHAVATQIQSDAATIERTVFNRAFRRNIPKAVYEAIEKKILNAQFYRVNHQGVWTLTLVQQDNEWRVKANVSTKFTLSNLTAGSLKFVPRFIVDERSRIAGQTAKIISIALNGKKGRVEHFAEKPHPATGEIVYEYEEQIVAAGNTIDVSNEFEFLRYLNDHEMWSTLYPSDGMKLRFFFPENCKVENFKIEPIGDLEMKIDNQNPRFTDVDILEPVLPHQGLLFYWRFIPLEESAKSGASVMSATQSAE